MPNAVEREFEVHVESWDDMVRSGWKLFASLLCWMALLGVMAHC